AIMPAQQGVLHWPPEGPNAVTLADETELPLPDVSMDRVLLVHGLECSEHLRDMLREIWRVMTSSGRLLIVVPNRRGIWSRTDRPPLRRGPPFPPAPPARFVAQHNLPPDQGTPPLFHPAAARGGAAAHGGGGGADGDPPVPDLRRGRHRRGRQADLS